MKQKLLVVLGQTATGKTDLAINLAKRFSGELVSADSRQVYKGLDLGTGKLPSQEVEFEKHDGYWLIDGIKVWLYDLTPPSSQYNVYDYTVKARQVINLIHQQAKLPIIVGGTGLYIKALLEGLSNFSAPQDSRLRKELASLSLSQLTAKLESVNPQALAKLNQSDRHNPRRLIRAIEINIMNPYTGTAKSSELLAIEADSLKIGLTAPRSYLNHRIDLRLHMRIKSGLVKEGEKLHRQGLTYQRMRELGLEYGCLADLLEGKITQQQFENSLKIKIHQFAKEQFGWFKRDPQINWFDISQPEYQPKLEQLVVEWYDKP